jgi:type IV secretory pathway VirB4 component
MTTAIGGGFLSLNKFKLKPLANMEETKEMREKWHRYLLSR